MVLNVGRASYSLKTLYTPHNLDVKCSTLVQLRQPLEHAGMVYALELKFNLLDLFKIFNN
jgi:hypothetical protein